MDFPPEHSRLFGCLDARGWGEVSTPLPTPTPSDPSIAWFSSLEAGRTWEAPFATNLS